MFYKCLGKKLDSVWYTGIVVYGREYYYSQKGVESCQPVRYKI